MVRGLSVVFAVVFLLGAGLVSADEKLGVKVYPGAKPDGAATDFLKQMSPQAAAYKTTDSLEKVLEFYKKHSGLRLIGTTKEGGMFRKGHTIDVTVQNPWMDTKTGKMMNDTLLSIVRHKE